MLHFTFFLSDEIRLQLICYRAELLESSSWGDAAFPNSHVKAIQQGQISSIDYPEYVKIAAQDGVSRLRARGLKGNQSDNASVETIDCDTLDFSDVRSAGCERLCLRALENLQLDRILGELGMSKLDTRLVLGRDTQTHGIMAANNNNASDSKQSTGGYATGHAPTT